MRECQQCKSCYPDAVTNCPADGQPTARTIDGDPVLEGKYHLESRIGQGGMGVVYKARHAYLKTLHAIKIILPDLVGNDPQLVTRFRQEALAAAAIRHQNVVSVTDYGVINGTLPFLVMEFVEGESLHDLLAREKRLSPEHALELISAICAGVGAAHHQGIVHRDLKPLNIMICTDKPSMSQAVKILDFGLAKIKSGELLGSFIQAQTTGLMGSPYYMAPEQWADEDPDTRADIYSLGVMLYQMLAGDVPFKGSSIPAIMKKHVSDPAPTLADSGLVVSRDIELALQHALAKEPDKRTPTVEQLVAEFRIGIEPGIHTSQMPTAASMPVSSLNVLTKPPRANVYINNVSVGNTSASGILTLEGLQSGSHHLRISHAGFQDWTSDVVCDGKPVEVVAELQTETQPGAPSIPKPAFQTIAPAIPDAEISQHPITPLSMQDTMVSSASTQQQQKKKGIAPIIFGIGAVLVIFVLGVIGIVAAYMMGMFGGTTVSSNNSSSTPMPSPGSSPVAVAKAEMIQLPGGSFKFGRNDVSKPEELNQKPEHVAKVDPFSIDKTEVTNAEYAQFVAATGHPAPKHWSNNKPVAGSENKPVTYVSVDDANAFAAWRSKRDGVTYRLPTEQEWEYAARNGDRSNSYPWGDSWDDSRAVMAVANSEPSDVGSKPSGASSSGVLDLIGNVWEWTSSELAAYPGSNLEIIKKPGRRIMIRGGSANEDPAKLKITSSFRVDVSADQKEKNLGFRLVKPG